MLVASIKCIHILLASLLRYKCELMDSPYIILNNYLSDFGQNVQHHLIIFVFHLLYESYFGQKYLF